ncbi:hypothetical protein MTO96_022483 [Rhipicephalus appendiculatus]
MSVHPAAESRERVTDLGGEGLQLRLDEYFESRLHYCCAFGLCYRRELRFAKGGDFRFDEGEYFGLHDSFNFWCGVVFFT